MKDIFEDPRGWLAKAAGTGSRLALMLTIHAVLLVLGYLLELLVFFVLAGAVLPSLYLFAAYRALNDRSSSERAPLDRAG